MILEVKNLKATYNNHIAIENINFSINQGEYVCLVGENGSGKSTLIKTIMGLRNPSEGKIDLKIDLSEVSYLAQTDLKEIEFPATAKEIIMTGVQKHKKIPFYTKEDKENLKKVIKDLKIEDIINKRIGDLSGGQKQRVLLARSLIRNPKLIILDEPATGLDVKITMELYSILSKLNKEKNVTILMATHDLDELKSIKPRIICLAKTVKYDGNYDDWKGL
ncbi:MAG: metal ABC transporter ATP-binding protein [Clostridia bacterium]|nr:metal ABC transporter ATP-binding protein [Clostridia bacterium]